MPLINLIAGLVISALICAAATVLVAGAMAWGFVDTSSRTGFVYHWLYSGQSLASGVLGASSWTSALATYFVQYTVVFVLVLLVVKAVRRRSNIFSQRTASGCR